MIYQRQGEVTSTCRWNGYSMRVFMVVLQDKLDMNSVHGSAFKIELLKNGSGLDHD